MRAPPTCVPDGRSLVHCRSALVVLVLALQAGCVTTREEGRQLRADLAAVQADLEVLARSHAQVRGELEARLHTAEARADELVAELSAVREAVSGKEAALAALVEEMEDLRGRLREARAQLGRTRRTLHDILLGKPPDVLSETGEPLEIAGRRVPEAAQAHFELAEALLVEGRTSEAIEAYSLFLQRHPEAELAGLALFGIGEAHARRARRAESDDARDEAYRQAIVSYQRLLSGYPKSEKADRALFKIALAFEGLGNKEDARVFYEELVQAYPDSVLVVEARKRLK